MDQVVAPIERTFEVNGFTFAGQEWGMPGGLPILALHGWLDNCASFYRLAPLLRNAHVVALDLAGHGRSSHRGNNGYHIWQDVSDIFAIADELGWQQFALLGHSRGCAICTLSAGTFPNRITHLGLIDGILPPPTPAEKAPGQLAKAYIDAVRARRSREVLYTDLDAATAARANGQFPLAEPAAKALVLRGTEATFEGIRWTTDPHLKSASGVKLTAEQLAAFANAVTAPIKVVLAEGSLPMIREHTVSLLAQFPQFRAVHLKGGHHLHMEDTVDEVAAIFNEFFI